jgi:hypothetical protein
MENKEPNKAPKNFKEAALSHIPFDLIHSMEQQTAVSAADLKALQDAVLKKGPAIQATIPGAQPVAPATVKPALPSQPAFISYAIEGHVINVPVDDVGAAISMFYTLLAFVWSKDKNVAKILKQFEFKFYDSNKNQVYPKGGKRAKK